MSVPYSDIDFTIENFSCWNFEINGSKIALLKRDVADSFVEEIFLELFPRGASGNEKHLVLKFCNEWFAGGLDIYFISSDGSPIKTESLNIEVLDSRTAFFTGPEYEKVVEGIRKNEPYYKDLLTLRFRKKCKNFAKRHVKIVMDVLITSIKINSKIFKDFKFEKDSWNEISTIHYLVNHAYNERMKFYAFLIDSQSKTNVKFKVSPATLLSPNTLAIISLFHQTDKGAISKFQEIEHVFRRRDESVNFESLPIPKDENKNFYITIRLKIVTGKANVIFPINPIKPCSYTSLFPYEIDMDYTNSPQIQSTAASHHPLDVLTEHMSSLYQNRKLTDFQLHCGGSTFPVHKGILSARSPVFKSMLSSNTREVSDLDPHVLDRFLGFLYSGKVHDVDWCDAAKLYYAAHKYKVPSLKRDCAKILCDEMSVWNVGAIISLAHSHRDDKLKSAAEEFLVQNYDGICKTKEWAEFRISNPILFNGAVETINKQRKMQSARKKAKVSIRF